VQKNLDQDPDLILILSRALDKIKIRSGWT